LWLAGVEEEAAAWSDWALKEAINIMPTPRSEGSIVLHFIDAVGNAFEIMGFILSFDGIKRRAEKRIQAMSDLPDELAARRLEKATAAAEESRERLEEWRRAANV